MNRIYILVVENKIHTVWSKETRPKLKCFYKYLVVVFNTWPSKYSIIWKIYIRVYNCTKNIISAIPYAINGIFEGPPIHQAVIFSIVERKNFDAPSEYWNYPRFKNFYIHQCLVPKRKIGGYLMLYIKKRIQSATFGTIIIQAGFGDATKVSILTLCCTTPNAR